jgi:hypothetical protein
MFNLEDLPEPSSQKEKKVSVATAQRSMKSGKTGGLKGYFD